MQASDADSAPVRGAPGSLTASLRAAPADPSRGVAPLARRTLPPDPPEEPASAVETASEADATDAPADMDDANASVAEKATRRPDDVPADPPPAAAPGPSPEALSALAAENARLRAELDTTSAALADAVASRFAAERALDVASRTHTHYGRMATGRAVVVTREVADDLRNAIEDQRRETQTLRRDHERATRGLADARRAHAAELAALREALDDAVAETARANMERDVARLERLDEDEDERAKRDAPNAPLDPRARAVVDELRAREKEALETRETALNELNDVKAAFKRFKTVSNDAARELAEQNASATAERRAAADAEAAALRASLADAKRDAQRTRDETRALAASSAERDEVLADTLLRRDALERELDRATRALRRRGALVPTPEAEAALLTDAEAGEDDEGATKPSESSEARVAALEARVRQLTKQARASAGAHEREVATLRAEHASASEARDARARALGAEAEAATVAAARARRRAAAFEEALRESDLAAAVALAAATDAKESLLASLASADDPESRVVFSTDADENVGGVNGAETKRFEASRAEKRRGVSPSRRVDPPAKREASRARATLGARDPLDAPRGTRARRATATQASGHRSDENLVTRTCLKPRVARDPPEGDSPSDVAPPPTDDVEDGPALPAATAEAVSSRLRALEARVARREKHWAGVLREVHAAHAEETARAKRACAAAVETKNAQIRVFREKLNALAAAEHERRLRESGVGV